MALLTLVLMTAPVALMGQPLRVNDDQWPPYFFNGRQDSPPGLGRELVALCLAEAGHDVEFVNFPLVRLFDYLQDDRLDLVVCSRNSDREEYLAFGGEPLFAASYRPVLRSDHGVTITSLEDLDSLTIGHLPGLVPSQDYASYLEKRRVDGDVVDVNSNVGLIRMLARGAIDVYVNHRATALWAARSLGLEDKIAIADLDIRTSDYFLAVSKSSSRIEDTEVFLGRFDACLAALKQDGRYEALWETYGLSP